MYRLIHPGDPQQLPLRMLFHPIGEGVYLKACEADSFRGLVAALLDDPAYELAGAQGRLVERLRVANDVQLLAEVEGRQVLISHRDGPDTINIGSDEPLIRSLHRLKFVSLEPELQIRSASNG